MAVSGDAERLWYTGSSDEILHARSTPHDGWVLSGALLGDIEYTGNADLNLLTGDGTGQGTFTFHTNYNGEPGVFEGHLVFQIKGWYITGKLVLHGDDNFEGMKLMCEMEGWLPLETYTVNGHILNPHG
jgi:hypothetical protein